MADYKYDAFISYRHCELDKFVAEELHKQLEAYRLPRSVSKKSGTDKTKIERVFRDKDELPLTSNLEDPILKALSNSEFLIVICSPRLKESIWCRKEIETFIKMHGRDKVLAVLIEGEPADSFPDELLYIDEVVKQPDGTEIVERRPLEPLAADFRGDSKAAVKKAMKEEKIRLLAPMFGLNYDELKRRQRERRMKRIISVAAGVAVVSAVFGAYCGFTALKIKSQSEKIEEQAGELEKQNEDLKEQNEKIENQAAEIKQQADALEIQNENLKRTQAISLAKQAEELFLNDNRAAAVKLSYEALTEHDGIKLPYTADGARVLCEAVGLYDGGKSIRGISSVSSPGIILGFKVSSDGKTMISYDNLGNLILWDTENGEKLAGVMNETVKGFEYIDNDNFFYYDDAGRLIAINISSGKAMEYECTNSLVSGVMNACAAGDGKSIVARAFNGIYIIDVKTMKETSVITTSADMFNTEIISAEGQSEAYFVEIIDEKNYLTAVDTKTGEVVFRGEYADKIDLVQAVADEEAVYVLSYDFFSNISGVSIVCAYSRETGEKLWEKSSIGMRGERLIYSKGAGKKALLVLAGNQNWMLNAATGWTKNMVLTEGEGLYAFGDDKAGFTVVDSSGDLSSICDNQDDMTLSLPFITCGDLAFLDRGSRAYVGVLKNDNRINFYMLRKNGEGKEYTGERIKSEDEGISDSTEIMTKADALGLEDGVFVSRFYELTELKRAYVLYKSGVLKVYDTESKECIASYENLPSAGITNCGTCGDYYCFEFSYMGALIDKNGEIAALINDFYCFGEDNKTVVVTGRDDDNRQALLEIPIYTYDELMEKAEEFLK